MRRWSHRLAIFVLAVGLLSSACSRVENSPLTVSLGLLAADENVYEGRSVETQGIVRRMQDPDGITYEILEDDLPNRVKLEPASTADTYVDQCVEVIGVFHFDAQQGRVISVKKVTPVGCG